jgi:hypothetical protein
MVLLGPHERGRKAARATLLGSLLRQPSSNALQLAIATEARIAYAQITAAPLSEPGSIRYSCKTERPAGRANISNLMAAGDAIGS